MAGRNHSRQLTSAIEQLFVLSTNTRDQISAVAVALGPGSFSGLRVGISEAKGIAMALNVPLVGVNTLDLVAWQCRTCAPRVWCAVLGGRGDIAAAGYRLERSQPERETDYVLEPIARVAGRIKAPAYVAGPAAQDLFDALDDKDGITVERGAARLRRAGFLAELGRLYLDSGGKDQLFELEPLYLRQSAAEEKRSAHQRE